MLETEIPKGKAPHPSLQSETGLGVQCTRVPKIFHKHFLQRETRDIWDLHPMNLGRQKRALWKGLI